MCKHYSSMYVQKNRSSIFPFTICKGEDDVNIRMALNKCSKYNCTNMGNYIGRYWVREQSIAATTLWLNSPITSWRYLIKAYNNNNNNTGNIHKVHRNFQKIFLQNLSKSLTSDSIITTSVMHWTQGNCHKHIAQFIN